LPGGHHEKYDGKGYPRGLARSDIPLSTRIMALADVYDALTSRRVYKEAYRHDAAKAMVVEERGTHFDPAVVDAFLAQEQQFIAIRQQHADDGSTD
jgi:putative two-component system response regulator